MIPSETMKARVATPHRAAIVPVALTRTWKTTIPYQRVAGLDRMVHGDCEENDRNPVVDGKLTIAPAH